MLIAISSLARSARALLVGLSLVGFSIACSETAPAPESTELDPWQPMSDAALIERIDAARREAAAGDRQVLLVFIADWCEDCHEVVRLSDLEPARGVLEERYVVVHVEVGRFDRHRALLDEHAVDRIAALVVLDARSGERIARTTMEPITGRERGLSAEGLARWLREPSQDAATR